MYRQPNHKEFIRQLVLQHHLSKEHEPCNYVIVPLFGIVTVEVLARCLADMDRAAGGELQDAQGKCRTNLEECGGTSEQNQNRDTTVPVRNN